MTLRFLKLSALAVCLSLAACGSERGDNPEPATAEPASGSGTGSGAPAATTTSSADAPEQPAVGDIDENAVAVLKRMTETVAALEEFSLTLETGFDVTQPNGEKLEFGGRRTASIRRPDKAHLSFQRRSGEEGELIFDGTDIWAYDRADNVYATMPQPGDIDTTIDFVTTELGIPVPASDFFSADPSIALASNVLAAQDLGASTVGERAGRHIALRKPGVNYQIWVGDEDALPTRVVITYIEEPGQPQFWAQFIRWDTDPAEQDSAFEFPPPEGSEQIRFATYDSSVPLDEETAP